MNKRKQNQTYIHCNFFFAFPSRRIGLKIFGKNTGILLLVSVSLLLCRAYRKLARLCFILYLQLSVIKHTGRHLPTACYSIPFLCKSLHFFFFTAHNASFSPEKKVTDELLPTVTRAEALK